MWTSGSNETFVKNVAPLSNYNKYVDSPLIPSTYNSNLEFLFIPDQCQLMLTVNNNVTALHIAAVCYSVVIVNLSLPNMCVKITNIM